MKPAIVVLWEPAEAANANYFYDLEPLEVKQASLDVIPKFPNANSFKVRVVEPLPDWLNVSTEAFSPPTRLGLEVSMANVVLEEGEMWKDMFDLGFVLQGEQASDDLLASVRIKIRVAYPEVILPPEPGPLLETTIKPKIPLEWVAALAALIYITFMIMIIMTIVLNNQ